MPRSSVLSASTRRSTLLLLSTLKLREPRLQTLTARWTPEPLSDLLQAYR